MGAGEGSWFVEERHARRRKRVSEDVRERAASCDLEGLGYCEKSGVEDAVERFEEAVRLVSDDPEYYLHLARSRARSSQVLP